MSTPAADGFLALWNGLSDPALQAEYEAWHAFEHVPERVGSPGFAWARRYVALPGERGPAYFTLYGLDSTAALRTPRYQELIDHPTAWSARMRGVLSDFCREPCDTLSSHGVSQASCLATLRVRVTSRERVTQALDALVRRGLALGACWGRVAADGGHPLSTATITPQAARGAGFDAVLLVQHLREGLLRGAVDELQIRLAADASLRDAVGLYEFQSAVRQADLPPPLDRRQGARADLQQRFLCGDCDR